MQKKRLALKLVKEKTNRNGNPSGKKELKNP